MTDEQEEQPAAAETKDDESPAEDAAEEATEAEEAPEEEEEEEQEKEEEEEEEEEEERSSSRAAAAKKQHQQRSRRRRGCLFRLPPLGSFLPAPQLFPLLLCHCCPPLGHPLRSRHRPWPTSAFLPALTRDSAACQPIVADVSDASVGFDAWSRNL